MAILERYVQKLKEGEQDAYIEWEKEWEAIEQRLGGFPTKKHYWAWSGALDFGTVVWEREWESFSVMETTYAKGNEDPEARALLATPWPVASQRIEYYRVID
jgi:hypothetical protein